MIKKSKVKRAEKHKSVEDAKEQLENIEKFQQQSRKRGYGTKIEDISKSKQIFKTWTKRIKNFKEAKEEFGDF